MWRAPDFIKFHFEAVNRLFTIRTHFFPPAKELKKVRLAAEVIKLLIKKIAEPRRRRGAMYSIT